MTEGRHGYMVYNPHCQWIGRALELYGEYCEEEVQLFGKIIKGTDIIWEIGANMGSQSVALSKMVPEGRFFGFEPQIELFKILTSNLTLNGCENATPINLALGEEDGVLNLPAINYHQPNNFGGISLIDNTKKSDFSVEMRSIDSLSWIPSPNFMKIDVEGMEIMVLRGGFATISAKRPIIYIENDRIEKSAALISQLWSFGYTLYWHITPYYNPENYFKNKTNIYSRIGSYNMLCIHKDAGLNISGLPKITDKDMHPLNK